MPKGPRINKNVKRRIIELAKRYQKESKDRIEVVELIKSDIGSSVGRMPADETIANLVSWAWNHEPSPFDQQWHLSLSADYDIPVEANSDLLKIWKYSMVAGRGLTIREAQWIARLRGLVCFDWLLWEASQYAVREQVSELLKLLPDTTDLDIKLAFLSKAEHSDEYENSLLVPEENWPYYTAVRTGIVTPEVASEIEQHKLHKKLESAWRVDNNIIWPISPFPLVIWPETFDSNGKIRMDPPLSENAYIVFSIWLRKFSKTTKWAQMNNKNRRNIRRRLHDEVARVSDEISSRSCKPYFEYLDRNSEYEQWLPSKDLLNDVGCEI